MITYKNQYIINLTLIQKAFTSECIAITSYVSELFIIKRREPDLLL